jgi:hypothetical protein
MSIDPFEKMFSAPVEEKEISSGEDQLPAGDHIVAVNWKQLAVKEWAKTDGNPQGNVLTIGFGKKNHALTFENFALDPKWNWKLKQLYDAAEVEWGSSVEGLMQKQVAATVTINDKGYRNVRNYKSLDAVAKNPPKSTAAKQTKTQKIDSETGADLQDVPF